MTSPVSLTVHVATLLVLAGNLKCALSNTVEVCNGELGRKLRCPAKHIIMMTSAEYGRKEVGRCITEADEFMGCTNDVLPVLDTWCSGKRECSVGVPNSELENRNENCLKILIKYLKVEYTCLKIDDPCSDTRPNRLTGDKGLISSQSRDTHGCGSAQSPWIIKAKPGQTIHLSMVDFAGQSRQNLQLISCPVVYGVIHERALGINHTICGAFDRKVALYTSKTNSIEVYINSRTIRREGSFVLEYSVTGCPELVAPAHAWYKREGNKAVIGCESNDRTWHLTCTGSTWTGEIGNCTEKADIINVIRDHDVNESTDSVVIMTGIASGAVVLCVVAIVIGTVYVKKYRLHQETKHLTKTYATLGRISQTYYMPNIQCADCTNTAQTSGDKPRDMPRDLITGSLNRCTCSTLPISANAVDERQSIYNSISST